ncbi:Ulp1 protease family, C-terminal catalytic domain [Sesbania bispinosa]|nr:Ulp1 protease family, C-terminal catalytic domain [Sesbania bispinosa]
METMNAEPGKTITAEPGKTINGTSAEVRRMKESVNEGIVNESHNANHKMINDKDGKKVTLDEVMEAIQRLSVEVQQVKQKIDIVMKVVKGTKSELKVDSNTGSPAENIISPKLSPIPKNNTCSRASTSKKNHGLTFQNIEIVEIVSSDDENIVKVVKCNMNHKSSVTQSENQTSKKRIKLEENGKIGTNGDSSKGKKHRTPKIPKMVGPTKVCQSKKEKAVQWKFKPTANMGLLKTHAGVWAYVFQGNKDPNAGNIIGTRQDFDCLCPGKYIFPPVVQMMALKVTWNQKQNKTQTVWCLPPSFAEDVIQGNTADVLCMLYTEQWMQPFPDLKHIYIPIEEFNTHWYLMVISVKEHQIYHFDSHLNDEDVSKRRDVIRNVSEAVSQIIKSKKCPPSFLDNHNDFGNWDIENGRGVPNCGLRVLSWIDMQNAFTPSVIGVMNENLVRMKIIVDLLLGNHNESKNTLLAATELYG